MLGPPAYDDRRDPVTRILHLSDTHATATGVDMDGVDAAAALERVLHDVRHVPGIELVVVSGDVADDGSETGYRAVREQVGAFARARGIPHVYCTGNHDDRSAFGAVLGSGHLGPDGEDRGTPLVPGSPLHAAYSIVDGLRVATLDTLVPGHAHGALDGDQLDALAGLLATPAPAGTVLVLHHPPFHIASLPLLAEVVLRDIPDLRDVVRGTDVRAVLAGHLHHPVTGFLAGTPVWVAPGVVTRIDTTAPAHLVRGVLGAGAGLLDLGPADATTYHLLHARDPRAGELVYLYDAASGEDVAEER
ncbi:metallophosphoesterase [Nocardioides ochotonae]|uniref:metallophosphoesterase n=1 Tax=Nocardioides ochotonae TaxID=2685869 RepID=UPI001407408D|nr:metallophosphoesterase [Nocardioides ochotonae]